MIQEEEQKKESVPDIYQNKIEFDYESTHTLNLEDLFDNNSDKSFNGIGSAL